MCVLHRMSYIRMYVCVYRMSYIRMYVCVAQNVLHTYVCVYVYRMSQGAHGMFNPILSNIFYQEIGIPREVVKSLTASVCVSTESALEVHPLVISEENSHYGYGYWKSPELESLLFIVYSTSHSPCLCLSHTFYCH